MQSLHTARSIRTLALACGAAAVAAFVGCGSAPTDTGEANPGPGERVFDPCDPNPCTVPNRSVCTERNNGAKCMCDPGFVEDSQGFCAVPSHVSSDPCDPNPCTAPNRSRCIDGGGSPVCMCDPGFADDAAGGCSDPCAGVDCGASGSCQSFGSGASCVCDAGFIAYGLTCVPFEAADGCTPNPCTEPNRAMCSTSAGAIVCLCDPSYIDDGFGQCTLVRPK